MFDDFGKKYGYKMRAEYLIDQGYYNQTHRVPSKEYKDYMDFVQSFVTETVKDLVTITHEKGKEAMMFLGDCWIGAEIYGDRFKELNLDAIVGSVGGGVTVRMLSDVQGVKYKEGRFLPYFFPDTFFDGNEENAVKELSRNWITARRAMMRNPLDRIGFGGYLSLAAKFPKFIARAGEICDEFRNIYDIVKTKNPMSFAKVAVLNAWGKIRSWMCNMTAHELWYQQSYSYQGIYEALSGLPVDVSFIDFDDVKKGRLKDFDVIINAGDAGTAWSGGENWADEKVITEVREFVYNGVTANLTMMAFTKCGGRIYKFFGTDGELVLDEEKEHILLTPFGGKTQVINLGDLTEAGMSHGGGDGMLIADLYDMITGKRSQTTSLASSIESHLMGIAAEKSRLARGKNIYVH